ncbi:MAG: glycosyltransferase family 2 protein [Candidatus Roizmanbacteria bacterium]|nr:glycosyltransferase family 2 protein [Candidatus Roizmanbacteria bacterium]
MSINISIIIPTYNNPQLESNLLKNMKYMKGCEVIIINDNPIFSLVPSLENLDVKVIRHNKNKGFAGAINTGIRTATQDYLFFLNDDVLLQDDSFQKAVNAFQNNPKLFAIACAQIEKNGETVGKNILYWKNGFIQHDRADNLEMGPTGWAEGGSALFDAKKVKLLGGLDELYSPFYWEDIDLSFRAKQHGFEVIFDPDIQVIHHHETTIGSQFSKKRITSIAYRNQLICIWKNITSVSFIIQHKYFLLKLLVQSILKGDSDFLKGFFQAVLLFPQIVLKRFTISHIRSDHEILEKHTQ